MGLLECGCDPHTHLKDNGLREARASLPIQESEGVAGASQETCSAMDVPEVLVPGADGRLLRERQDPSAVLA